MEEIRLASTDAEAAAPLELITRGNQSILRLSGEIGTSRSAELQDLCLQIVASGSNAELDWSAAERIHASTLQVLLALGAALAKAGRELRLSPPGEGIRQYLETAGFGNWAQPAVRSSPPVPAGVEEC